MKAFYLVLPDRETWERFADSISPEFTEEDGKRYRRWPKEVSYDVIAEYAKPLPEERQAARRAERKAARQALRQDLRTSIDAARASRVTTKAELDAAVGAAAKAPIRARLDAIDADIEATRISLENLDRADIESYMEIDTEPVPGFHVNVLAEFIPKGLERFVVERAEPFRVFAGWSPEEIAAREPKADGGID